MIYSQIHKHRIIRQIADSLCICDYFKTVFERVLENPQANLHIPIWTVVKLYILWWRLFIFIKLQKRFNEKDTCNNLGSIVDIIF